MEYEVKDITPADYIKSADGVLRIDPELRERMHCQFVVSLRKYADEAEWTMRLVHGEDHLKYFPGVIVYPPGQNEKHVLTGYRIEGGLMEELNEEQAKEPYVGRYFEFVTVKQRAFAGPLDLFMPAILLEKVDGHFFLGGQAGAYDPDDWAKMMMNFVTIHHEHTEALKEIERKYAGVRAV